MKIKANSLPTEVAIATQNEQDTNEPANSSAPGGLASQPSALENALQTRNQNSFESAIGAAGFKFEVELNQDQTSIAADIGVNETPGENKSTIGGRRDAGKSSDSSSQDPQTAARQTLRSFLNNSGQNPSQLDDLAQKIFTGDISLPTDQERSDGLLKEAGIDGLVNTGLRTDLFEEAESTASPSTRPTGKGMIAVGDIGFAVNVYENFDGKTLEQVFVGTSGIATVKVSDGNVAINEYYYDGTKITTEGNDKSKTETTQKGETTTTTTTTKNGTTTTTTTTTTTKNPDGTTTTTTTESTTTTETTPAGGGASTPAEEGAPINEFVQTQLDRLRLSLRAAGPQTGGGDIDPDENAEPTGGTVDAGQIKAGFDNSSPWVGQPSGDDFMYGGRPIGGMEFGPTGNIDWGPDSDNTGSTDETRGGDATDVEFGSATLKPTPSSNEEEEEE